MSDLRPEFFEDAAESQTAEGGSNWNDNCVPTSFAMVMAALGYGDPAEPQDWTDYEYGAAYHGGEEGSASIDFIRAHPQMFPNPPAWDFHPGGAGVAAYVHAQLGVRRPMVGYFHCTQAAKIVTYEAGFYHASCPVADDAKGIAVWNVWSGYEQYFTDADFERACVYGVHAAQRNVSRAVPVAPIQPAPPPALPWFMEDFPMRLLLPVGQEQAVPAIHTPCDLNFFWHDPNNAAETQTVQVWARKWGGNNSPDTQVAYQKVACPNDSQFATNTKALGVPDDIDVTLKFVNDGEFKQPVTLVVHHG